MIFLVAVVVAGFDVFFFLAASVIAGAVVRPHPVVIFVVVVFDITAAATAAPAVVRPRAVALFVVFVVVVIWP